MKTVLTLIILTAAVFTDLGAAQFNAYLEDIRGLASGSRFILTDPAYFPLDRFGILQKNVPVLGTGDAAAVKRYGGRVRTVSGNYFTALVPVSALDAIKSDVSIKSLSYLPAPRARLDVAVPLSGTAEAYAAGYKGGDVIVGIIDTGIEWRHPDFKTPNGMSRIQLIWDQTDNINTSSDVDYGMLWTKSHIDMGLCEQHDHEYHGTHVAGIAAGNGSASEGFYTGMAPEANIIAVKLNFSSLTYVIDAVDFIFSESRKRNKPCVVNLSLGTQSGPHTATDTFNLMLDSLVEQYGPGGRIIVWAAGNEGGDPLHASNRISSVTDVSIPVDMVNGQAYIEFWYSNAPVSFSIRNYPGLGTIVNTVTDSQIMSFPLITNGFRLAGLTDGPNRGFLLTTSTNIDFRVVFEPGTPMDVHGYMVSYYPPQNENAFTDPDYNGTIMANACQGRSISVAALVTRSMFTNQYGTRVSNAQHTNGRIAWFSSRGPTRDGVQKPEITAPGAFIISVKSYSQGDSAYNTYTINTNYMALQGTSMAAPAASGLIALMLEKEPYLTVEDVRARLQATAMTNAFKTGTGWTSDFGYGIISISTLTHSDAARPLFDVSLRNNILTRGGVDSGLSVVFRANSSQAGRTISVWAADRYGSRLAELGSGRIEGIEVIKYEWNGQDKNGVICAPGVYFIYISVDGVHSRYPVLIAR